MSSVKLIQEEEVMKKLHVTSRTTMWKYCQMHNFPKPVRTRPKPYLESAVDDWIINGGTNQKASCRYARTAYLHEAHTPCADLQSNHVFCRRPSPRPTHVQAFSP